jgi:PKD repeat protein
MLLAFAIAASTTSCDLFTSTARGISIRLSAAPLVPQLGDTVTFTVVVSANEVTGVLIDFGDSTSDQSSTGGLPTAVVTFTHVYGSVGNYMSRATISDAAVGTRVVTQEIMVIPRDTTQPPASLRTRSR